MSRKIISVLKTKSFSQNIDIHPGLNLLYFTVKFCCLFIKSLYSLYEIRRLVREMYLI